MTLPLETGAIGDEATRRALDLIAIQFQARSTGLLVESTAAGDETTASLTYVDLATVGPAVTIPWQGVWEIEIGCMGFNSSAGAQLWMSYAIGGTTAVDADGAAVNVGVASGDVLPLRRVKRKTLAVGTVLTCKYRTSAGTMSVRNVAGQPRYIKATFVG